MVRLFASWRVEEWKEHGEAGPGVIQERERGERERNGESAMVQFISDDALRQRAGEDVVEYVQALRVEVETHKARADAAIINAEQACSLVEQKFLSLTEQFGSLENEKRHSIASLERRSAELAEAHGKAHKLELDAIKHGSDLERVSFELGEVRKSKRDLLEIVDQKNAELDEKNASIKTFLDKIVTLTDERSIFEGKLREHDADVARSNSLHARLQQEKELLEQHNTWLNEELTAKVSGLIEERRVSSELEADLQSKLVQAEKLSKDTREALQRSKERVGDLEAKLSQTREELRFTKEQAALQEDHSTAEISTATKLADLYKASAEDWSSKSNELEGVIKAIETHLNQVEADYREKLDKEIKARETVAKEAADLKEKLTKALEDRHPESVQDEDIFALPAPTVKTILDSKEALVSLEVLGEGAILPTLAVGISGTALAAALLRDGWSLSTMYSKYQDAVDAYRHEKHERKNSQALLERVLREIEMKAEVILDERAEHTRMLESYNIMEEKLYYCMEDQGTLENSIKDLKADLRRKEREVRGSQKEISDLQIQVAGLLQEDAEVKQKYEAGHWSQNGDASPYLVTAEPDNSAADAVISEKLVTFKDIKGMVEQNSQLRILVRDLAEENEQKEAEMKEVYSAELDKRAEAAANKVAEVLQHYKEKEELIETLQGTVAMYKRLHEEELKSKYPSNNQLALGVDFSRPDDSGKDYGRLLHSSQEEMRSFRQETAIRIKILEEELAKAKLEVTNARVEQARVDAEGGLARDQMITLTQEAENRRKQMDSALSRNMEFTHTITNYQQQLRESSQKLLAAEEVANRFRIEASILEKEKELLASAEKRASNEVALLSDRAHRLQASLDTFQSIEEAREDTRAAELKKLQDDWSHLQKEWTESRKELEVERRHSRDLTNLRDKAVKEAMDRVEAVSKELADALRAVSAAETNEQLTKLRCTELEASLKKADEKIVLALTGGKRVNIGEKSSAEIDAEILANLQQARDEVEQLKEDLIAAKGHTDQYKRIAAANEEALNKLEAAHNVYKGDVDHMKEVMEAEIRRFTEKVAALEFGMVEKEVASTTKAAEQEVKLNSALKEISTLQESLASSLASLQEDDARITTLKKEVDKYHHQWRDAQQNYERQILLQADTIRELTSASDRLTKLEKEEAAVRIQAETAEAQLASLQVSWSMEKSTLESLKVDADNKWKALEEQNRLLLDRVEAVHITSAEHARKSSAETGGIEVTEDKEENDLQNVLRYLRRSKETAETEVSLLKQERLRLQRQLDASLRAAEDAQSSLRREQENARASLYSEEEFRSLQAQVREINLMRESNAQLREENRRNFEDSRESRNKVRQAHAELEPVRQQLREKEIELEASGKELDLQKSETQRWQNRVSQLLDKYKTIDVEDYQRLKTELVELQEHLKKVQDESESGKREADALKKELDAARDKLEVQQNEVNEKSSRLNEQDKKILDATQAETTLKADLEKFKRHAHFLKRKIEILTKEKDDLVSKEIDALSKQVEELKANAGKRASSESRQESARQEAALRQESAARLEQVQKESEGVLKEKETRIQILEKTLERERESLRKEKHLRQRDQKTFYDVAQKAVQAKREMMDELEKNKREAAQALEKLESGSAVTEPAVKSEIGEKAVAYVSAVNVISEVADNVLNNISHLVPAPGGAVVPASAPASTSAPVPTPVPTPTPTPTPSVAHLDTAQPQPVVDASAVLVDTPAGGPAAPTIVPLPNAGTPVGTGSGSVISPNTTGVASSSVAVVSAVATSVARPPTRPASSNIPPSAARPPLRQPPSQAAVPDQRERDIAQLRAQILEREKEKTQVQAGVMQARKIGRRLIRPRIEPDVVTDMGDTLLEGTADAVETDMESEDTKLSTVSSDAADLVPSSVSALQVTMVTAPALDVAVPPSLSVNITTASVQSSVPSVSSVRKRPAMASEPILIEEVPMDLVVNSENAHPQKRPRAVELTPEDISQEVSLIGSTVAVGASVQGDAVPAHGSQSNQGEPEVSPSDGIAFPAAVQDSVPSVISHSESERERPATEISDVPPQKRPRFVRPETSLPPQQVVTKDQSVVEEEALDEKMLPYSDEPVHHTDVTKQVKGEDEIVVQGNSTIELLTQDQEVDIAEIPSSSEQYGGQPISVVMSGHGNGEEEAYGHVARSSSPADVVALSRSGSDAGGNDMATEPPTLKDETQEVSTQAPVGTHRMEAVVLLSESDIPLSDPGMQLGINADAPGADEGQEVNDETEEGEIPMDVGIPETGLVNETGGRDNTEVIMDPEKLVEEVDEANAQSSVVASTSEQIVGETVVNENQESIGVEVFSSGSEVILSTVEVVGNVDDTGAQEQRIPGEQQIESSSMVTRQLLRASDPSANTTINLADRAKERAALRRGVLNPQPPAARGRGRAARGGAKRAPGAARGGGRLISTGIRGRGQAGGNTAAAPEGTRSTQPAGPGTAGQPDQIEINPTPNPYEALPREGED